MTTQRDGEDIAEAPPPEVEVRAASLADEPLLANLFELYAHDLSEFFDLQPGADGRFGCPPLPLYWREAGRFPFVVRVRGAPAGFVLVSRGSRVHDDPEVWDVAEFFVLRACRGRGIGVKAAHDVWGRFPGRWEVRVLERNAPALGFWRAAIAAFAGAAATESEFVLEEKRWRLFSFTAP